MPSNMFCTWEEEDEKAIVCMAISTILCGAGGAIGMAYTTANTAHAVAAFFGSADLGFIGSLTTVLIARRCMSCVSERYNLPHSNEDSNNMTAPPECDNKSLAPLLNNPLGNYGAMWSNNGGQENAENGSQRSMSTINSARSAASVDTTYGINNEP